MLRFTRVISSTAYRAYSKASKGAAKSAPSTSQTVEVKGLSEKCVKPFTEPLGPGAKPDGEYKVPEYFAYNRFSFAEAEIEMLKYRCPQPSAVN